MFARLGKINRTDERLRPVDANELSFDFRGQSVAFKVIPLIPPELDRLFP